MRPLAVPLRAALALAFLGCSPATITALPSGTAPGAKYAPAPNGPVHFGAAEEADAGFVRVDVKAEPCGGGVLGVKVRLRNTGSKVFELHRASVTGRASGGDALPRASPPYNSACKSDAPARRLEPGEAATTWYHFAVPDLRVEMKVDLDEPDGLSRFQAVFHLDQSQMERTATSPRRPVAPSPRLVVRDAPYYRLTVVDARACKVDEELLVRYEVVLENFSNVALALGRVELVDERGTSSTDGRTFAPACGALLSERGSVQEVEPGDKRRGWLPAVSVSLHAKSLVLNAEVHGTGLGAESFKLELGSVPRPSPTAPRSSSAVGTASAPPAPSKEPPQTGGPRFGPLPPIPTDPVKYNEVKLKHLVKDHHVFRDNFMMSVVPVTHELWAAGFYAQWSEKRYDLAQMTKLTRDYVDKSRSVLHAHLVLLHHGDLFTSGGEHSLTVPDDIAEFVFLEVDGAPPIRCTSAEIPLMGKLVGPFSKQSTLVLSFELGSAVAARLRNGSGKMRFVVGGLGFTDKTIRYDLPLSSLTSDAPVELQRVFKAVASTSTP